MTTILIPTVKHTGSHLALEAFLDDGFEQQPTKKTKFGGKTVIMDHVLYTKTARLQEIARKADSIVVPLRHPLVAATSWRRNGEELEPDFFQMYEDLELFLENALLLPLDVDDNSEYVEAIYQATGVTIDTTRVVASRNNTERLRFDDPRLMDELKEHQKVSRFAKSLGYIQSIYEPVLVEPYPPIEEPHEEETTETEPAGDGGGDEPVETVQPVPEPTPAPKPKTTAKPKKKAARRKR